MRRFSTAVVVLVVGSLVAGCGKKPPLTAPTPPPPAAPPAVTAAPPAPPTRVDEALPVPAQPLAEDTIGNRSLDDLNRDSPFRPVFFPLDASDLDDAARAVAQSNADLLK